MTCMQRRGVADRGDAEEAGLAGFAQGLERRDDFVQHLRDAQAFAAAISGDRVVQVEDIHMVHPQALQAAVHRVGYGLRDRAEVR